MKPSPREMELLRLLAHARGCDGLRCAQCRQIDLRLGDWPHSLEDPAERLARVDQALAATHAQAERLFAILEGSSMPASCRRVAAQICEWLVRTREMLVLPVTKGDAAVRAPAVVRSAAVFTSVWVDTGKMDDDP